jgi:hypothetical protein
MTVTFSKGNEVTLWESNVASWKIHYENHRTKYGGFSWIFQHAVFDYRRVSKLTNVGVVFLIWGYNGDRIFVRGRYRNFLSSSIP